MSQQNIEFELQNSKLPAPSTTPVRVLNVADGTYGSLCVLGYCGGAPATYATAAGTYALACIMVDTVNKDVLYNTGTVASPTWTTLK